MLTSAHRKVWGASPPASAAGERARPGASAFASHYSHPARPPPPESSTRGLTAPRAPRRDSRSLTAGAQPRAWIPDGVAPTGILHEGLTAPRAPRRDSHSLAAGAQPRAWIPDGVAPTGILHAGAHRPSSTPTRLAFARRGRAAARLVRSGYLLFVRSARSRGVPKHPSAERAPLVFATVVQQ